MKREEILNRLEEIIQTELNLDISPLQESARIYEDLNIDSLMVLQLIVYLEESFEIEVPAEDVDPATFLTVGSLVDFVSGLVNIQL